MLKITLGGVGINTGVPDANGALWYADKLEGWDGPDQRLSMGSASSRHGEQLLESMLGGRGLVLSGKCKAVGEAGMWTAYNDLLALTAGLVTDIDLVVYESVPKRAGVIRASKPRIDFFGSSFDYSLNLRARDPLKYALSKETVSIAAGATKIVVMPGSFSSPFVATTAGSTFALRRTTSGEVLRASGLTGTNTFDTGARTAYRGSVNVYGKVNPMSVWWDLQPGSNSIKNEGSASVSLSYYNTWI